MEDKSTPPTGNRRKGDHGQLYEGVSANITITFNQDVTGLLLSWYDFVGLGIFHEDHLLPWRKQQHGIQINSLVTAPYCKKPFVYDDTIPLNPTSDDIQRIVNGIANEFIYVFDRTGPNASCDAKFLFPLGRVENNDRMFSTPPPGINSSVYLPELVHPRLSVDEGHVLLKYLLRRPAF